MKILVISAAFPPMQAGEADHTFHLCQNLAARGLDVHVLTTKRDVKASDLPIKVYPIMHDWSWSDLPRLALAVTRCRPDAIVLMFIGWIYGDHPMITFAPTISKILLPRVPFVTQFENAIGAFPDRASFIVRAIRKGVALWAGGSNIDYRFGTLLRDSDRLIVLSDHHRATLSEHFPDVNSKSELIPTPPIMLMCPENNGSVRQHGRKVLGVDSEDFLIAYLGYIYPRKGIETLLKALQIVSRHTSNVRLVVVGGTLEGFSSYAEEIYELPRRLGIDDRVIWTGEYSWDSDEASIYLRAADACVLPIEIGIQLNNSSFAAAAAHGLPIITTQGTILEQPFVDQENVLLCPPKDPEAMAAAIRMLIDAPDLRERLGAGALSLARDWFSWERAIERTMATFGTKKNFNANAGCL